MSDRELRNAVDAYSMARFDCGRNYNIDNSDASYSRARAAESALYLEIERACSAASLEGFRKGIEASRRVVRDAIEEWHDNQEDGLAAEADALARLRSLSVQLKALLPASAGEAP